MHELKTELLEICEAFNLGAYEGSKTISPEINGFIHTQFYTSIGTYNHYFKIK